MKSSLFLRLSVKPALAYWENRGLFICKEPESKSHKTTLRFNYLVFLRAGIHDLSFSNACDRHRVNILSCRRSTFCLPEPLGSKGLFRVKVWVSFAKEPRSSSANRSWRAATKPGAASDTRSAAHFLFV